MMKLSLGFSGENNSIFFHSCIYNVNLIQNIGGIRSRKQSSSKIMFLIGSTPFGMRVEVKFCDKLQLFFIPQRAVLG